MNSEATSGLAPASRLAAIVESSDDAIVSKDLRGYVTSWNRAAERIFGYSADEAIGQNITIVIPVDRRHEETRILERIRAGLRVEPFETVRRRKDGRLIDISLTVSPILDAAGRVVGASKIARDISGRRQADQNAYRLAAIVESSDDVIVSKDLDGYITSWNGTAERTFGYTAEEAVGQHIMLIIPVERREEEDAILARVRSGERVEHFETVRQRKDGTHLDVSLTVSPIRDAAGTIIGCSKIARDITETKRNAVRMARLKERYEALNAAAKLLAGDLDLDRLVQATTDIATRLTGAKFGAFFYNVINEKGESYQLFTLSGAPKEAFEKFGMPRNTPVFDHTFRGLGPLRSDDIRRDPRYGKNPPHQGQPAGHLPVVSYLAVPVVSRSGEVIGGLFFGHEEAGRFDAESEELALGIAAHAAIAMDNARLHLAARAEIDRRRRAEETQDLLLHEIKHRVKNMLGTIDAVAFQTLRELPSESREQFSRRIRALAGAHDLLTEQDWRGIDLRALIDRSLAGFPGAVGGRLTVAGPHVLLNANASLLMALVMHELGTNALKYGAWSNGAGVVDVAWQLGDGNVEFTWQEAGGPAVATPTRQGFGSTLIRRALNQSGGEGSLTFPPAGALCCIRLPRDSMA